MHICSSLALLLGFEFSFRQLQGHNKGALRCENWDSAMHIHSSVALASIWDFLQAAARAHALQGCQATAEAMCPSGARSGMQQCIRSSVVLCQDLGFFQAAARAHALQGCQAGDHGFDSKPGAFMMLAAQQ